VTKIGVTLPQFTDDPDRFTAGAEKARALGFDSVWLFDHLWPLGGVHERPILECWTALAYVAAAVPDVELGTLVTRSSLRNPALLAKMAATVGAIAPGRVIVGLGSGDALNRAENRAFGAPFFSGADRIAQLVSTLEVVQRFLKTERAESKDRFANVSIPSSPRSSEPVRVWLGGRSVEVLEVAGRVADGWNGWGANLDGFAADASKVKAVAGTRAFDISWAGQVILGPSDEMAAQRLGDRDPALFVTGGPATVRRQLAGAIEAGATHLIVALPDAGKQGAYEDLAEALEPLR
jgi:alkanesulfonate monooxygenase SsuD/methylene tetrahydromethanopterin reductase-like flavin-dependent oxidoreductase (luciferase family)